MKANILSVEKVTIPQYSAAEGRDVDTLMIRTLVEFVNEDGTVHHTQAYAQRPEEVDQENPKAYFDKQADVMQAELEGQRANREAAKSSELADSIVDKLKK